MKELSKHFLSFPVSRFQFDSHNLVSFLKDANHSEAPGGELVFGLTLSLVPTSGQGAVRVCVSEVGVQCVGLTWGRSPGEGLGDCGGRVT